MKQYLLDTSTCVFFIRKKLNLDDAFLLVGQTNCFISEMTIAELRYGAEKSLYPDGSHKSLNKFCKRFVIVPILGSIRRYAEEKVRLEKLGTPLHDEFDLFIGATAIINDFVLVTDNTKHFARFQNIQLENWLVR